MKYEQIPHTADLAVTIYGKTLEELFENAAFAMFDISSDLTKIEAQTSHNIEVSSTDEEALLIAWLNELLFLSFSTGEIFKEITIVSLQKDHLTALVRGQSVKNQHNIFKVEIKAATHHDVKIQKTPTGYEVTVVFDI